MSETFGPEIRPQKFFPECLKQVFCFTRRPSRFSAVRALPQSTPPPCDRCWFSTSGSANATVVTPETDLEAGKKGFRDQGS